MIANASAFPPRGPGHTPTTAVPRLPPSGREPASGSPSAVDLALGGFRARFDRLSRDDAGRPGFFLNLLL